MKIIEAGETCKRTCRFTCENCGCIFEAEGDEMTIITNKVIRKPDVCLICTEPYVEAKCPWCGDTVEEPLNSVSLINLMRGVHIRCVGEE